MGLQGNRSDSDDMYGYSSGKPSEKNVYSDIRAVYDYVRKSRPNKKIVLLGYSIGTAPVADLAASQPEGLVGVVLVAPFTSGLRLVEAQPKKPNTSILDRFNTSAIRIGYVACDNTVFSSCIALPCSVFSW
ncbi:hypothetical protein DICVIV_08848 [Dictyocaulus viviparus]|uniref:Serine aminopeptidase S33 domain-containing protein n=1 Tax=Dictyocaulus viviparus TaxID=29172 RepID=A0A0D8XMZ2_DICVI|nr:hypothetical protein DICVIV_08848 [Dictyocaulus viviparus]